MLLCFRTLGVYVCWLCLRLIKADLLRSFILKVFFSFGDSALLVNVVESRGGIGASHREREIDLTYLA